MRKLGMFDIPFTGLKLGRHQYQFEIDKTFFDQFEFSEISEAHFNVDLVLEKQSTMLILHFDLTGEVDTICDSCGESLLLPVSYQDRIIVKFGDEDIEQSEEIWVIPHHEHKVNVSTLIYEFAHLSIPNRRIHPAGACNEEVISKLDGFDHDLDEGNDPRWDILKEIKKDLK